MGNGLEEAKKWLSDQANFEKSLPQGVQLSEFLDRGGQGVVYTGTVNGEPSAVKIYYPGQTQKRIQREIDALIAIDCPTIVKLLASGTIPYKESQLQLVATQLIPGITLDKILSKNPLTSEQLAVLAYDVSQAVQSLWERRIVHRDLKPSNILRNGSGRNVVIDLGLARHIDLSPLSSMGVTWGTWGYLSPEQTRAVRQLTCKSDIYTLGVILLESATGRHPTSGNQEELLEANFHVNLPVGLQNWEHAAMLQSMFHPKQIKRPLPTKIMQTLQKFQA